MLFKANALSMYFLHEIVRSLCVYRRAFLLSENKRICSQQKKFSEIIIQKKHFRSFKKKSEQKMQYATSS